MKTSAVFLDRDGTIIEDVGYLGEPEKVRLLPGASEAICRLRQAGFLAVVVSNQSGIARGLFDQAALNRVHARMEELLAADGAKLDGVFYCPFLDGAEARVEAFRRPSELRKPQPGMLLEAAAEMNIDLASSWMIGDSPQDIEAGRRAGCRTVLVRPNGRAYAPVEGEWVEPSPQSARTSSAVAAVETAAPDAVAASLFHAALIVERKMKDDLSKETTNPAHTRYDRTVVLLEKIHDQLDHLQRNERQQDFSVLRLFGALLQMFALVAGLAGFAGLMNERFDAATTRFALACFLQLAALSAFLVDRFR